MTRDVEIEISLGEMWQAVKKHWLIVLVVAVICGLVGGAFGYWRLSSQQQEIVTQKPEEPEPAVEGEQKNLRSEEYELRKLERQLKTLEQKLKHEEDWYNEEKKMANDYEPINSGVADKLRAEWSRLINLADQHPFMNMNPDKCTWERLTLRFEPDSGSHYSTLLNWINDISDHDLFGIAGRELSVYRDDLISIEDRDSESSIVLTKVDKFDIDKAVNTLKKQIRSKAKAEGIKLTDITTSHFNGRLQRIFDYQLDMVNRLKNVQDSLEGIKDTEGSFQGMVKPEDEEEFQEMDSLKIQIDEQKKVVDELKETEEKAEAEKAANVILPGISKGSLLKYGIIGLLLGAFLGACLVIFVTIMRGRLISRRQVEDAFGFELLGDCSENDDDLSVLNSNLDLMIGDGRKAMLISTQGADDLDAVVQRWNLKSEGRFIAGHDIIEDSDTIDSLQEVEGIVFGIRIGDTKASDVQRLLLRIHKLEKKVLGYVEM